MMTRIFLGLTSTEGDQLGHLVRGVQMLRSYGEEASVIRYFDVINQPAEGGEPPAFCTLLECSSSADLSQLQAICKETEWALGQEKTHLTVQVVQYGDKRQDGVGEALQALLAGQRAGSTTVAMEHDQFARLCGWGQQRTDGEAPIIGEWPSATGP